jgi:hypothetical protein
MRISACLAASLLAILVMSCATNPNDRASMTAENGQHTKARHQESPLEQARKGWALGCAAVLTERNHHGHTSLAGRDLTEKAKEETRVLLADWWGVSNRADLLKTLAWLEEEGHRADFETMGMLMTQLTQDEYEGLLAAEDKPEAISKMEIARTYYPILGAKSLYGWDYSRAICLCRWAYAAGYITEQEAWTRIMPIARSLQEKFDSWEDFGNNFLIGRQFWSHEQTTENGWQCEDAVQRLLDMRDSPWNQYPWDLDLSEDDPAPDQPKELPSAVVARG